MCVTIEDRCLLENNKLVWSNDEENYKNTEYTKFVYNNKHYRDYCKKETEDFKAQDFEVAFQTKLTCT